MKSEMQSINKLIKLWAVIIVILLVGPLSATAQFYNVKSYGATGNGSTVDTGAIQSAVNAAHNAGGGVVTFPPGTYKMGGGITLTNDITIVLTNGAYLKASTNQNDWGSSAPSKIFYAVRSHDISILGTNGYGLMDGGGLFFYQGNPGSPISGNKLNHMIEFHNCTDITLDHLHLQNSCEQTIPINDSTNVTVTFITITNRPREFGSGDDGIDFSDCVNVFASDLNIETGDDGICVKTENGSLGAHDIWIQNSTVATTTMATKFGTATYNPAYNVVFTNITVNRHPGVVNGANEPLPDGRCEAAINVCMCNGGFNHDVVFTHYTINDCSIPIYMEVNDRSSSGFGISSNIFFGDINCLNASNACQINVQSGATSNIKNITISNLTVHNFETYSGTSSPPFQDGGYPYGYKIGSTVVHMPGYGLFARYVNGLTFAGNNQFFDDGHSGRPKDIVLENCSNVTTNSSSDFSISATPGSRMIVSGNNTSYTTSVSALNGFSGTVNLTVSGLPSGVSGNFSPTSVNGSGSSTLNITTSGSALGGSYTVTITGTSGSLVHSTNVTLILEDFSINATPSSRTVVVGNSTNYTATIGSVNGFGGTVSFSASGLPANANAVFNPTSVSGAGTSTITVSTSASTPTGTDTLTITGTSGSIVRSTNVTLIVAGSPNPDFSLAIAPSLRTVTAGDGTTYTNTVSAINGFSGTVTFSVNGLPSGASGSFSPTSVSGSGTSILTVTTTTNISSGTYNVNIVGTSGSLVHSNTVTLIINAAGGGLPSGWTDLDIGSVPAVGSATVSNGIWTVKGSGSDIWNQADVFNYAYENWSGNATGIVRVVSQSFTNNAKAGIMFRETTADDSACVMLVIQPSSSKGLTFACRPTTGGSMVKVVNNAGAIQPPEWLKLVRSGNTFTASYSANGTSWTTFGSTNVTMDADATLGLAVTTASTSSALNTATFDNVNFPAPSAPDFSLATAPSSQTVTAGDSTTYTNTVSAINGFSSMVIFSVNGLPSGASGSFSPTSVSGSGTSVLTVTTTTNVSAGTYNVTVVGSSGSLVHSNTVTLIINAAGGGLPSGWTDLDIGNVPAAGSATVSNGIWTVKGSGSDIWNQADVFNYAYENWSGNATGIVRIVSQSFTNNAKAGIMFRETTDDDSACVMLVIQPSSSKGLTFACRPTTGGSMVKVVNNAGAIQPPEWLKLVRSGNTFTASYSANGTSWTTFGSTNVTMDADATLGLAVTTASTSSALNTATFNNLSMP